MNKQFLKDAFVWGVILWLIGYVLGIIFFTVVPPELIGWAIMPIGIVTTLWVLLKKVKTNTFKYYLFIAFVWTFIALVCDYFLLVNVFKPADGYYKLDVYIYYGLTFILPVLVGLRKNYKAR